jgi:molybdenum cofactor cytidylyltransferase
VKASPSLGLPLVIAGKTMQKKITAIILAAGSSSRMGQFKPLLKLGEQTMIEVIVATFIKAGISDIRVVVGQDKELLTPVLERLKTRIIINDNYSDGMFSSMLVALDSLESNVAAFFLLPADIPLIRPWTIKYLIENSSIHEQKILVPSFMGRRGHPPLIPSIFLDKIKEWRGCQGLKGALTQLKDETVLVKVADENILVDVDDAVDYGALKARFTRYHVPSRSECEALLCDVFRVEERIYRHSLAVAALTERLLSDLNKAGRCLDEELIVAASLLHDMAKGEREHDRKASRILLDMGYPDVADMVGSHMNIVFSMNKPLGGAEVVYLADKFIREVEFMSLEIRLRDEIQKRGHDPEVRRAIENRFQNAMMIRDCIESIIGGTISV